MKTLEELDRLCGEKIMGYELLKYGNTGKWLIEGFGYPEDHWQPTRDIRQAWECLEKLNVQYRIFSSVTEGHCCEILQFQKGTLIPGFGQEASLAIVRACLAARGVELE